MTRPLSLVILLFASLLAHAGSYTQSMFQAALANNSTAPDFVLIQVRGPNDRTNRTVCTGANFLLGAIQREYDLDYTEAGEKQALAIALKQPDRSFIFRKKAAMDNLADDETPEALADVRRQFEGKTDSELLNAGFVQSVINKTPDSKYFAYKFAAAHALLERGIGCKIGDIVGILIPHR